MKAIALIIRRSFAHHRWGYGLTIFSIGLSFALCLLIFSLHQQSRSTLLMSHLGYDAVLGARGSSLQLVLNSVYHMDQSPGNLPYAMFQSIKKHPSVKHAVPYLVGDNHKGYRIVGTDLSFFESYGGSRVAFDHGGSWNQTTGQAVLGATVARELGLSLNDVIYPYHGLQYRENARHDNAMIITGIMSPTNTPADRVVWIPMDGFYTMEGHVLKGSGEVYDPEIGVAIPDQHKEVSAVMLKFINPMAGLMLSQTINHQGKEATLAFPIAKEILNFYDKMGWLLKLFQGLAILTLVIGLVGMVAAISNTLSERREEFAILRALGARRTQIFMVIFGQCFVLSIAGTLLGVLLYALGMGWGSILIRDQVGVHFHIFFPDALFWQLPLASVVAGCCAGWIPAWTAYRHDVAADLNRA